VPFEGIDSKPETRKRQSLGDKEEEIGDRWLLYLEETSGIKS